MNNMERLPADSFFLDLELRQEVERMASLGYAPDDIASYLGLDAESFVFDAGREGTTVYSLMRRGALKAMELLEKVRGRRSFEIIVKQIDEDEFG